MHDWAYSVYGKPTEEIPMNAPPPKGKPFELQPTMMQTSYSQLSFVFESGELVVPL
jgi:hypothetical protein